MKSKEQMIKREQYDIFTIVTDLNQETKDCVLLTLGNFILAKFEDITECKEYINAKPYELIIAITSIIADKVMTIKKEQENGKQD